jgi:hypothetical protein
VKKKDKKEMMMTKFIKKKEFLFIIHLKYNISYLNKVTNNFIIICEFFFLFSSFLSFKLTIIKNYNNSKVNIDIIVYK